MAIVGAVVVAGGLLWLHFIHVDLMHAFFIVGFLFLALVVLMASVDGDALALVAVLVLALIFATKPSVGALPDGLEPVAGEPYILVLGDSYMSGEGADEYLAGTNEVVDTRAAGDPHTNECRQAPTAWPFVVAGEGSGARTLAGDGDEEFPSRVLFLACAGAVTEDITTEPLLDDGEQEAPTQLALYEQAAATLGPPAFVIVGIGGNDAGFGDIVSTCVGPGNCAELAEQFLRSRPGPQMSPSRSSEALAHIDDDLERAYANIRDAVGEDVPIIATSYPIPINAEGHCWRVLLNSDERVFVRSFAAKLNEQIQRVAHGNDVIYMDIARALVKRGKELCSTPLGNSGLNFLAFASKAGPIRESLNPGNWMHNSLHPNVGGHQAFADDGLKWFRDNWPLPDPPSPPGPPIEPDVDASIDQVTATLEQRGVAQCEPQEDTCDIRDHGWLKEQAEELYDSALFPVALTTIGLAVALAPLVRCGRERRWSLWTVVNDGTTWLLKRVFG
jgi:hypothetical protein